MAEVNPDPRGGPAPAAGWLASSRSAGRRPPRRPGPGRALEEAPPWRPAGVSPLADRCGGKRPAGAGSGTAAAAGRWRSSPGGRRRCGRLGPRGRGPSGCSRRSDSPTSPTAGRGHKGRAGCRAGRGGPPDTGYRSAPVADPGRRPVAGRAGAVRVMAGGVRDVSAVAAGRHLAANLGRVAGPGRRGGTGHLGCECGLDHRPGAPAPPQRPGRGAGSAFLKDPCSSD